MNSMLLLAQETFTGPSLVGFDALGYVLRILHILAAVILAGGIAHQRLVLLPALQAQGKDPAVFFAETRGPWSKLVAICALVLIAGGLVNFILITQKYGLVRPYYHLFFGVKFLLALVVIFIASVFGGRKSLADKFRAKAQFWLSLNLALVVILILLASAMRIMPKELKPPTEEEVTEPAVSGALPAQSAYSSRL